jgi:murein DD-endopeptidase MepM/ murein hydrolase activator NlpD
MPTHATRQPPYRRRIWHVVVAVLAAVAPAAAAFAFSSPLDAPATVDAPAERIFPLVSGGLLFPIAPTPMCEFLNNYREPSRPNHVGTDIGAQGPIPEENYPGQEIYAVEDGTLYEQWLDTGAAGFGWGLHSDTDVKYRYFHLASFAPGLDVGDRVARGQLIGYVGDTGNATKGGWHLHFEVKPGPGYAPVDPAPLLAIPSSCQIYGTVTPAYPTTTSTAPASSTSTSPASTSSTTSSSTSSSTSTTSSTTLPS